MAVGNMELNNGKLGSTTMGRGGVGDWVLWWVYVIGQYICRSVMNYIIHTICSWCPLRGREATVIIWGDETKPFSHGICEQCYQEMMGEKV